MRRTPLPPHRHHRSPKPHPPCPLPITRKVWISAATRPANRYRAGCCLRLRLSASTEWLEVPRRRVAAVLSPCRRTATIIRRRNPPARRLSGTACRPSGFHPSLLQGLRTAASRNTLMFMWSPLRGVGRASKRQRRRAPHGRPAAAGHLISPNADCTWAIRHATTAMPTHSDQPARPCVGMSSTIPASKLKTPHTRFSTRATPEGPTLEPWALCVAA